MTNKEALKIAKSTNPLLHQYVGKNCGEYVECIIEALEKQIPKKPTIRDERYWCQCKQNPLMMYGERYCRWCGQRIDWSEEE